MSRQELIPHLFRTEFHKITAVLCKLFGIDYIQTAEDIAAETFLTALETWPYSGIPENPVAWLYTVAKNKAKNQLQRNTVFRNKISNALKENREDCIEVEIDLSEKNITDSQLQMLFAICHPTISPEAQVGLALRVLCGFGIDEIANALLSNREAINKKLFRAREKLRTEKVRIEFPPPKEITHRLATVLKTLYLLFNEGYYSETNDMVLREDLCLEAMRLSYLLVENEATNQPEVNALLALMCFHASRFQARRDEKGEMVLYVDQDQAAWNHELIKKGVYFLHQASGGNHLSTYHLEAGIAYWHTVREDSSEKWENILQLYNHLLQLQYSPIAALNRTYALSKIKGKQAGINEAEQLLLTKNPYYFALLGELYTEIDNRKAKENFLQALSLAKTTNDKQSIRKKLHRLEC